MTLTESAGRSTVLCHRPQVNPSDGTVYFGCWDTKVYALSQQGNVVWTFSTQGTIKGSPTLAFNASSGTHTLYIGSDDDSLYALAAADGALLWSYTTGGNIDGKPLADDTVANGTVYFGSADGKLRAVRADGSLGWEYVTGGPIHSSPALLLPNGGGTTTPGAVTVGSNDNKLHAVSCPPCALQPGCVSASSFCTPAANSVPALSGYRTCHVTSAGFFLEASGGGVVGVCTPVANAESWSCNAPNNSRAICSTGYYLLPAPSPLTNSDSCALCTAVGNASSVTCADAGNSRAVCHSGWFIVNNSAAGTSDVCALCSSVLHAASVSCGSIGNSRASCLPGFFAVNAYELMSTTESDECVACPVGRYHGGGGTVGQPAQCTQCAAGHYATTAQALAAGGSDSSGSAVSEGASLCRSCPAGRANPTVGGGTCWACQAGRYTAIYSSTGGGGGNGGSSILNNVSVGATHCALCPASRYNSGSDDYCERCAADHFTTNTSSLSAASAAGGFGVSSGATHCLPCQSSQATTSFANPSGDALCDPVASVHLVVTAADVNGILTAYPSSGNFTAMILSSLLKVHAAASLGVESARVIVLSVAPISGPSLAVVAQHSDYWTATLVVERDVAQVAADNATETALLATFLQTLAPASANSVQGPWTPTAAFSCHAFQPCDGGGLDRAPTGVGSAFGDGSVIAGLRSDSRCCAPSCQSAYEQYDASTASGGSCGGGGGGCGGSYCAAAGRFALPSALATVVVAGNGTACCTATLQQSPGGTRTAQP